MKFRICIVLAALLAFGCVKTYLGEEDYYERKYGIIERLDDGVQKEHAKKLNTDNCDPEVKKDFETYTGTLCDGTGNIKRSTEEIWLEQDIKHLTGAPYLNAMYHDVDRFKCELLAMLADEEIRTGKRFDNKQAELFYQTVSNFVMDKYDRQFSRGHFCDQ